MEAVKPVRIVSVSVNRLPCSCVYDCPLCKGTRWESTCRMLNKDVTGHVSSIPADCPLTVEGEQ